MPKSSPRSGSTTSARRRSSRRPHRTSFTAAFVPQHERRWPRTELLEDRRLLAAGDVDTSYGTAGLATAAFQSPVNAQTSALEADGKLLVAGGIQQQGSPDALAVARFNTDGTLDTTFGNNGTVVLTGAGTVQHIVVEPDGGILLAGLNSAGNGDLLTRLTDAGTVDTTFGSGGSVTLPGLDGAGIVLESDGKIIAVGEETGKYDVARLLPDGSFDPTFGTAGVITDPMPQGSNRTSYGVADAVIQPDGSIVTSAMINQSNVGHFELARFTPAGTLDTTFGNQGTVETSIQIPFNSAETLNLEPDGRILLAGSTLLPPSGGNGNFALVRYNSDGTPDNTFGTNGQVTTPYLGWITKAMLEPSGTVMLAGTRANVGNELIRLNADGTLDDTFGTGGVVDVGDDGFFSSVVEQADGKYVFSSSQSDAMVAERFVGEPPVTTSGIADITLPENNSPSVLALPQHFQGGSVPADQLSYSIAADSNPGLFGSLSIDPQSGNLTLAYAANQFGSAQITIKAADPDGASVETTFNVTLTAEEPFGPGKLDPTFGTGGTVITPVAGIYGGLNFVHVLANGQIVAAGDIQENGSNGSEVVALYNADGSLDTNFGQNGFAMVAMNGGAGGAAIQPDGKIVVSGDSTTVGTSILARFNADGSLDTSFGTDGIVTTTGASGGQVAIQADGKIVVVNNYNQGNLGLYGLVRYNSDGTLDTTFGTGGMVTTVVGVGNRSIPWGPAVQSDGKIVLGGWAWDGSKNDFGVVRYNTDGTLDSSFGNGGIVMTSLSGGNDEANDLTLQPDGKIVVSGYSSGEGGLVRYNADGTLDTSFGNGGIVLVPASGTLYQPIVQPNGDIVVAGDIGNFGFAVLRFLADGKPDTTFNQTGYAQVPNLSGVAEAIAVEPDGDYLVAGTGNTSASASSTFVLARFDGSFAPTTSGIGDITLSENSKPSVLALPQYFQGGSVPASELTYSIVSDSNVGLFASLGIDPQSDNLTLAYAANQVGSAEITIRATDPDGGTVDATFHVTVSPVLTAAGTTLLAVEGATFSGTVATFTDISTDPPGDYTATIDWGDGAMTAGTVTAAAGGGFAVVGSHVYAEEGENLPVTVVIGDPAGAQVTATSTANVADAKLHIAAVTTVAPSGGMANNLLVATFTDDGGAEPAADYSATIDWGDGTTTAGTITRAGGVFDITGSHQYARAGVFTVGVSVSDDGGSVDGLVEQAGVQLTPHQEYVIAVYHDVLGRAPDPDGLAYWSQRLDSGAAIGSVAEQIAHSDEYYANFVIAPDYLRLLGRAADSAGLAYWTAQMHAGATDQQLEADLVSSEEFFQAAGGSDTAWIDAVYKLLLGRTADPDGESYWNGQLAAGQTLDEVAQRIATSAENNKQLIEADYFHYLGRAADSGGLAYWLQQFAAGRTNEDVIVGFVGSPEYYTEHSPQPTS